MEGWLLTSSLCSDGKACAWCRQYRNAAWRKHHFGTETPDCPRALPIISAGLGDTIARAASAVGIAPCGGCKERQEWMNKHFPYGGSNANANGDGAHSGDERGGG